MTTPVAAPVAVLPAAPVAAAPAVAPVVAPVVVPVVPPVAPAVEAAAAGVPPVVPAVAPVVPATVPLELRYPEGFKGDPAALEAFKPVATELGLTAAQAQKLVEFTAKNETARLAASAKAQADALAAGQAEIKADPALGGANYDKTIATSRAGVKAVETVVPGVKKWLESKGLLEDPTAVRLFKWIGDAQKDDTIAGTGAQAATTKTAVDHYRALYNKSPNMTVTG